MVFVDRYRFNIILRSVAPICIYMIYMYIYIYSYTHMIIYGTPAKIYHLLWLCDGFAWLDVKGMPYIQVFC